MFKQISVQKKDVKLSAAQISRAVHGEARLLEWDNKKWATKKAIQKVLHEIGGFQSRLWRFLSDEEAAADTTLSAEEIHAGFDFIRDEAPMTTEDNAQLRWLTIQKKQVQPRLQI